MINYYTHPNEEGEHFMEAIEAQTHAAEVFERCKQKPVRPLTQRRREIAALHVKIITMHEEGAANYEIAKALGISHTTVSRRVRGYHGKTVTH